MPIPWTVRCSQAVVALTAFILLAAPAVSTGGVQETEGAVLIDGLFWAVENNGDDVNWNTANQFCQDLRLGGHDDWRLPTIEELQSVYEPEASDDYRIRRPLQLTSCCLWSSTLLEEQDDPDPRRSLAPSRYAWGFYFANGDRYYSAMGFPDGRAQCVRAAGN